MDYEKLIGANRLAQKRVRVFNAEGKTMGVLSQTAPNRYEIERLNKWTSWGLLSRDFDRVYLPDLKAGKVFVAFPAGIRYRLAPVGDYFMVLEIDK